MQWATKIFLIAFLIPVFLFAKVEIVNVEVEGLGSSKKAAIDSALVEAVSQVNGAEIASKTKRQLTEVVNDEDVKSSEAFNQEVSTITDGLIKNWKILSESLDGNNHLVKLSVNISKFKKSVQTDRLRLGLLFLFSKTDSVKVNQTVSKFEGAITAQLENYLTQTRRFALIDRSFLAEQTKELNLISAGSTTSMSVDEIVKLRNRLGTDYLVVGRIEKANSVISEKKSKVSDTVKKYLTSTARITIRLIDVATTQIKFADTYEKTTGTSIEKLDKLAVQIGQIVLGSVYPIRIVNASSSQVVLGQGGKTVKSGDFFKVYQLGKKLIDPYTKESLGREEIEVAVIQINNVKSKTSDAKILESILDLSEAVNNQDDFIVRPFKAPKEKVEKQKSKKTKNC